LAAVRLPKGGGMTDAPVAIAPNIVSRLTLARYQLTRARLQMTLGTEFGAWQAALALHDAAEICLLAIADYQEVPRRDPKTGRRLHLHDYPRLLEGAAGKSLGDNRSFYDPALIEDDLSEVRNSAKHRGGFPSVSDVTALCCRVEIALDHNCSTYLGFPLSAVSLADMVEDEEIRAHVKEAEGHLDAGRYTQAIIELKHAWHDVEARFHDRVPGADIRAPRLPFGFSFSSSSNRNIPKDLLELIRDIHQWSEAVQPKFALLLFGVDVAWYEAFKAIGPIAHFFVGGGRQDFLSGEEQVLHTADSAQFSLTFVLDSVVRLQELERVRQPRSHYNVQVRADTEYFVAGSIESSVGVLTGGTELPLVRFCLGPWPNGGWTWADEAGRHLMIPFEAAVVTRVISPSEHLRTVEKNLIAKRPPPPPVKEGGS
jgi:hypothetical protein